MNKKSNRDTAPVRREIPSLSAKNHISKNQGWLPRRIAPRQPLSISLNVKLGGVFWTKFEHQSKNTAKIRNYFELYPVDTASWEIVINPAYIKPILIIRLADCSSS